MAPSEIQGTLGKETRFNSVILVHPLGPSCNSAQPSTPSRGTAGSGPRRLLTGLGQPRVGGPGIPTTPADKQQLAKLGHQGAEREGRGWWASSGTSGIFPLSRGSESFSHAGRTGPSHGMSTTDRRSHGGPRARGHSDSVPQRSSGPGSSVLLKLPVRHPLGGSKH